MTMLWIISMVMWEYIREKRNNLKAGNMSKCKYMPFDPKDYADSKNTWVLLHKNNLRGKINFSFKIASRVLDPTHFT